MPRPCTTSIARLLCALALLVLPACADTPESAAPTRAARQAEAAAKPTVSVKPTSAARTDAAPAYEPRFEPAGCPFDSAGGAIECGYLVVPERRTSPDEAEVRLAVAIVRSTAKRPAPDPLVYLEGGPGGSALYDASYWLDSRFRNKRDIILIDQRGTGYSLPSLNCPELESEDVVTGDDELDAAKACSRRLRREGVDLKHYNSAATAADLADLRQALGLEEVNLLGVSYGTRAALTALRDFPEGIRSVILDSSYPPEVDAYTEGAANGAAAIQALLGGCAADADCAEAFPKLDRTLYRLVDKLNGEPAVLERTDVDTGETYEEELYGDDLVSYLFDWLYDTSAIPLLPRAIAEAAEGDYSMIIYLLDGPTDEEAEEGIEEEEVAEEEAAEGVIDTAAADEGDISDSEGAFYSVECREEMIFGDLAAAEEAVSVYPRALQAALLGSGEQTAAICEVWGSGRARAVEDRPVTSDVPTLVLAGEYDPVTPPHWGESAAEHLSRSFFYTFPGMGHGVVFSDACPEEIALSFLERPGKEPDAACLADLPGPVFEIP
ncbi:MAG: hypothetical protein RLZZ387_3534 [Chloroflexota bacterium]|jgi:pimeloyl-ACP methyl ester carboxylesterase